MRNKFTFVEPPPVGKSVSTSFVPSEFEATIRDKGYLVNFERALLCPCKDEASGDPLSYCKNCGGSGFVFGTPVQTTMLFTSIMSDRKFAEAALMGYGMLETGSVNISANFRDKFTWMDRITILDATSVHNQVLYVKPNNDNSSFFAFTIYDIVQIEYIAAYVDKNTPLRRLSEDIDYTFENNVVTFLNPGTTKRVTIRYRHNPVYHITDMLRDAMTSTNGRHPNLVKITMPVFGIGRRAHLVKDVENLYGTRILENRTDG